MSKKELGCGLLLLPVVAALPLMALVQTVLADWLVTPRLEPEHRSVHLTIVWIFLAAALIILSWIAALAVFFTTREPPQHPGTADQRLPDDEKFGANDRRDGPTDRK